MVTRMNGDPPNALRCGSEPEVGMEHETGKRILVIEDDVVVSGFMEDTLAGIGMQALCTSTVPNAMIDIDLGDFDAAVVDMNLRGDDARPVLLQLMQQGIPFMVVSGSDQSRLVAEFPDVRFLAKPFDLADLVKGIYEMLDMPAVPWPPGADAPR
jgi:DNA-binding response OmpR family regulator